MQLNQIMFNIFSGTGDLIALQDFQYIPDDIDRSNLNHYAVDNWLKIWGTGRVIYTGTSDALGTGDRLNHYSVDNRLKIWGQEE